MPRQLFRNGLAYIVFQAIVTGADVLIFRGSLKHAVVVSTVISLALLGVNLLIHRLRRPKFLLPPEAIAGYDHVQSLFSIKEISAHLQNGTEKALSIVRRSVRSGAPFALYLRPFSSKNQITDEFAKALGANAFELHINDSLWFENALQSAFGSSLPVIAVKDPLEMVSLSTMPMIVIPPENWIAEVGSLIRHARAVIVYGLDFSSGVSEELKLISELELEDKTVVVLPDPSDESFTAPALTTHKAQTDYRHLLFTYSRIIMTKEIKWQTLSSLPQFDFLQNIEWVKSLSPEQRRLREKANRYFRASRPDMADPDEKTTARMMKALDIWAQLGDGYSVFSSAVELAATCQASGRLGFALGYWKFALDVATRYDYARIRGLALMSLSSTHYLLGNLTDALKHLTEAESIVDRFGSDSEKVEVLQYLAAVNHDMGNYEEAIARCKAALHMCEAARRNDRKYDLLVRLLRSLMQSHKFQECEPFVREALELRQHAATSADSGMALVIAAVVLQKIGKDEEANEVRRQAIQAYASLGNQQAVDEITTLMNDPNNGSRSAG